MSEIQRLVRMSFQTDRISDFMEVFEDSKEKIRNFPGCLALNLIVDFEDSSIIYTSSIWRAIEDLENYRNSKLFIQTWRKTKIHFKEKAQTNTFNVIYRL
jgi:quinol monooxygenase YgiN